MGNRAIITTRERKIGLYLHWNGGRDTVEPLLSGTANSRATARPAPTTTGGPASARSSATSSAARCWSASAPTPTTRAWTPGQRHLRHRELENRRAPHDGVRRGLEPTDVTT